MVRIAGAARSRRLPPLGTIIPIGPRPFLRQSSAKARMSSFCAAVSAAGPGADRQVEAARRLRQHDRVPLAAVGRVAVGDDPVGVAAAEREAGAAASARWLARSGDGR